MAAATILDFRKVEILTDKPLSGANMHQRAKFHQNRSNGCRDIWRFNGLQIGGRPPSWICEIQFLTVRAVKRPILHQHTTFFFIFSMLSFS